MYTAYRTYSSTQARAFCGRTGSGGPWRRVAFRLRLEVGDRTLSLILSGLIQRKIRYHEPYVVDILAVD